MGACQTIPYLLLVLTIAQLITMAFCIPLQNKKTATEAVNEIREDEAPSVSNDSTMTEIAGGSDVANQRRSRDVACPEPTPEDLADIVSNAEDTVIEIVSENEELEAWTSLTGWSPYLVDSCNHRDVIANAALNTRTLCPYTYEAQTDTYRYPQTIPQVRCNCTDCYSPNEIHQDNTCRPVFKDIPVLRRGGSEDDSNDPCRYHLTYEPVSVGCVCTRVSSVRSNGTRSNDS